jgi:hypothetical protein
VIKYCIFILLITLGCVGIAAAGGIPVDPGLVYASAVTTGDYSPVLISAIDPGLYSSPVVQPYTIPSLSPQWDQSRPAAPEPTRDTNPVYPDNSASPPVNMPSFNPVPAPLPILAPSVYDTPGLSPLASDIDQQMSSILIPDYESGKFFPTSWGYGGAVGEIITDGTTNWGIKVVFDRSVTIDEAYAIIEKHRIPDGYRILIEDTPRNNPPDSVTFFIDYNNEQPDSLGKTIVDILRYDPQVKALSIIYGTLAR